MCDSVNHTRFPKEDHLPDWVCRDKYGNKGDRVEYSSNISAFDGHISNILAWIDPKSKNILFMVYLTTISLGHIV